MALTPKENPLEVDCVKMGSEESGLAGTDTLEVLSN